MRLPQGQARQHRRLRRRGFGKKDGVPAKAQAGPGTIVNISATRLGALRGSQGCCNNPRLGVCVDNYGRSSHLPQLPLSLVVCWSAHAIPQLHSELSGPY